MWVSILTLFEWIGTGFVSAYLIWFYARKNVEWYTFTIVGLSWFLGFSIIVLLPYDVYISYILEGDSKDYSINAMELVWRINYWVAFLLCYFVFPMLGEYVIAGDFTVRAKLWTAIVQNIIFYSVIGTLAAVALIFLYAKGQFDNDKGSFQGFLIFCTNAYGLILIILFLSYGVVEVPKINYRK